MTALDLCESDPERGRSNILNRVISLTLLACFLNSALLSTKAVVAQEQAHQPPAAGQQSGAPSGNPSGNRITRLRELILLGKFKDAEIYGNDLMELTARANDKGLSLAICQLEVAKLYRITNRFDEAEQLLKEAQRTAEQQIPGANALLPNVDEELSNLYSLRGDFAKAEEFNQKAKALYKSATPSIPANIAKCTGRSALMHYRQTRYQAALQEYQDAMDLIKDDPKQTSLLADLTSGLAQVYGDSGQLDLSYQMNKEAVRLCEQVRDPFHPMVAQYLANLAYSAIQLRSWSEAEGYIDRALDIERSYHQENSKLSVRLQTLRELTTERLKPAAKGAR